MISEFLQFGYLGLLGMLLYLCYQIIVKSGQQKRPFKETLIILVIFSLISLIGGGAGYFWASKELEVAKAKKNAASIIKSQIEETRKVHQTNIAPLQLALDEIVKKLNGSLIETNRNQYLEEVNQINKIIESREALYTENIKALKGMIEDV